MPTKLICHTPDCVSCGADGTCKLAGEIRVDQKRCQSYTPHSIPFMEKPLALSELPKEEWVCHILEESGATFVSLEDFYEPYGKALRRDLVWRIPYGCLDFSGCVLCLVQEGILCLPYGEQVWLPSNLRLTHGASFYTLLIQRVPEKECRRSRAFR